MVQKYQSNSVRQHPKTINRSFAAKTRISGLTVNGTSIDITSNLTSALSGGGYSGADLPLQVANGRFDHTGEGVVVNRIVELYDSTTKSKLAASTPAGDEEIYGKITESSGVYTLSFLYLDSSGVEQVQNITTQAIDFEFEYVYKFEDLPIDFGTSTTSRNIEQDIPKARAATLVREKITIVTANTVPALTYVPIVGSATVTYTGHTLTEVDGDFVIIMTTDPVTSANYYILNETDGSTIPNKGVWYEVAVGYGLDVGDVITVSYLTLDNVTLTANANGNTTDGTTTS